jgi:hypothetical protein
VRVMIDACVLYPTVMREVILGVAATGLFQARWSDRILEEWARAARKIGPNGETIARGEISLISSRFKDAVVPKHQGLEGRLWLPDGSDIHVLAAAINGSCDSILTMNAKDFPRNILEEEGLTRCDPDGFLRDFLEDRPDLVIPVADTVLDEARRLSGADWTMRALMKKARLPRFGKALTA